MSTRNSSPKQARNVKWDRAIVALLEGGTRETAAQAADVDPATLYRWMKDPRFQTAMLEARREAFGLATARVQQAASAAAQAIIASMDAPQATVRDRIYAAKTVLDLGRKSLELDDLKIQVAELLSWKRAEEGSHPNGESFSAS